jgi:hypothetical protein
MENTHECFRVVPGQPDAEGKMLSRNGLSQMSASQFDILATTRARPKLVGILDNPHYIFV